MPNDEWPEHCDPEAPRWRMTTFDKVWLEAGWLLMFVGIVLAAILYEKLATCISRTTDEARSDRASQKALAAEYHWIHWGDPDAPATRKKVCLQAFVFTVALVNFCTFAWMTESLPRPEHAAISPGKGMTPDDRVLNYVVLNAVVEYSSFAFFSFLTIVRLMKIHAHFYWCAHGASAPLRYAIADLFMLLELIALGTTAAGLLRWMSTGNHLCANLLWLFLARAIEVMQQCGAGVGFSQLASMYECHGKLLGVASLIGLVCWLVMSAWFFTADERSMSDGAVWCVAVHNVSRYSESGEIQEVVELPWRKFESIPSSMWFVLLNLCQEHPFADSFITLPQRLPVVFTCILAMPLFSLPMAVLQSAWVTIEDVEDISQEGFSFQAKDPMVECYSWHFLMTSVLAIGSAVLYFFYTARNLPHSTFLFMPVDVEPKLFCAVDVTVSLLYFGEWQIYLRRDGWKYVSTGMHLADLFSWIFGIIHLLLYFFCNPEGDAMEYVCAACLFRMFKFERYLSWLSLMNYIIWRSRYVLSATCLIAFLMWMVFSTVLYLTERYNYDEEMVDEYGSVLRSLWAEIINLHGEWPWGNYTAAGKAWGTLIALVAIMLFCLPISIFQDTMQDIVMSETEDEESDSLDSLPWQERCRPERKEFIALHNLFYAHRYEHVKKPRGYYRLRCLAITMVTLSTAITMALSFPPLKDEGGKEMPYLSPGWSTALWFLDGVTFVFFVGELVCKTAATSGQHLLSFVGLCDIISLVVLLVTLTPYRSKPDLFLNGNETDEWADDGLGLLRLLSLLSLETYFETTHMMKRVFWQARRPLLRTGCASVTAWFWHATLLYLFERPAAQKSDADEEEVTMSHRYASVLRALQYSAVHLFGDYPETAYRTASKVVHFVGIMLGIPLISSFCGVFTASFVAYLQDTRKSESAYRVLRRHVSAVLIARRLFRLYRERKQQGTLVRASPSVAQVSNWKQFCRDVIFCRTARGKGTRWVFHSFLIFNLVCTLIGSMPEIDRIRCSPLRVIMLWIEGTCTVVFCLEFSMHMTVCARGEWWSPFRVIDFICLFPGIGNIILKSLHQGQYCGRVEEFSQGEAIAEATMMIRAIRLLDFPHWSREMVVIGRALWDARKVVQQPAYLALVVWILTSALFMWLENFSALYYKDTIVSLSNQHERMTSLPDTMYWCCIFLTGEWAEIDFSFLGSRLCIFYVFFGITWFSIPTAIIVESMQASLAWVEEEDRQIQELMEHAKDSETAPLRKTGAEARKSRLEKLGRVSKVPQLSSQTPLIDTGQEIEMAQMADAQTDKAPAFFA